MPKARRITQEAVLELLQEQVGRGSALKAAEIVETLTNQRSNETQERELREIIRKLRLAGQPICTHSAHGYWWASSPNDLEAACGFLRGKAMSSLRQISKLHRLGHASAGRSDGHVLSARPGARAGQRSDDDGPACRADRSDTGPPEPHRTGLESALHRGDQGVSPVICRRTSGFRHSDRTSLSITSARVSCICCAIASTRCTAVGVSII
jgi:hypothetical protein